MGHGAWKAMIDPGNPVVSERSEPNHLPGSERPEIRVVLAVPRGFCAGVVRAIDAVRDAIAEHGPPVYVRRPIVHNLDVVRSLEAEGAIFVEELDEVPPGAVVLFSAHGTDPAVAREAQRRGLKAFDAVCPLVDKVHREVRRHHRDGRQIILIGHEGHPEIEGTAGHCPPGVLSIVSNVQQVAALPLPADVPAAYAVQTTYSVDDAAAIVAALRERFSDLAGPSSSDICYATTNRQSAVRALAGRVDAFIIVGEHVSSNASRLAEVARSLCASVQLVAGPRDLDWSRLRPDGTVGLSAAASTPDSAVEGVLDAIRGRFRISIQEFGSQREATVFKRMAVV